MSNPERPSLADTLARIDTVLAEQPPELPFGYVTPAERDLVLNVTGLDTSFMTRTPEPAPDHLPGAPGPTCPGCAVDAARPGWLDRLRRILR